MKRSMYLVLCFIFVFFCYYSYSLFQDIFVKKQNFSVIKNSIDENDYVLNKDRFIVLRNTINEKTNRNFSFSNNTYDGLGPYKIKNNTIMNLNGFEKYYISKYDSVISNFNQYLKESNIDFIYMESPDRNYFYKDMLDKYNLKYDYNSYKKLYKLFRKKGISYIDTHSIMKKLNNKKDPIFYNTDFHITSETGKNLALYLGKYINDNYGYNLNLSILDNDNFDIVSFKKSFNGFYIRKFGLGKKYYEDFNYYMYNKYSDFIADYDGVLVSGSFKEALYNNKYDNSNNAAELMHMKQLYGIKALKKIENKADNVDKKILVIADSQFQTMGPYISLMFKNLDVIDIRTTNGNFKGSMKKYIKDTKPDMVLYFTSTSDINDINKILN